MKALACISDERVRGADRADGPNLLSSIIRPRPRVRHPVRAM